MTLTYQPDLPGLAPRNVLHVHAYRTDPKLGHLTQVTAWSPKGALLTVWVETSKMVVEG